MRPLRLQLILVPAEDVRGAADWMGTLVQLRRTVPHQNTEGLLLWAYAADGDSRPMLWLGSNKEEPNTMVLRRWLMAKLVPTFPLPGIYFFDAWRIRPQLDVLLSLLAGLNDEEMPQEPDAPTLRTWIGCSVLPARRMSRQPRTAQWRSRGSFFFLRLPNGQYGPVSRMSHPEYPRHCTGPFNWGGAHCAGEKVKRKTGPFLQKSHQKQAKTNRARPATATRNPPARLPGARAKKQQHNTKETSNTDPGTP